MKLACFGGDARMLGALAAARRAGWEAAHIVCEGDDAPQDADAVMLPWPHSFKDGLLVGTQMTKEQTLRLLPACRMTLFGAGLGREALTRTQAAINPAQDEGFQQANAALTAEGAIARAMARQGEALLGGTCVITGFGRIGQALARRLTAMEAFVIVCARNENQMRLAHAMGAHPMALSRIAEAIAQADVVLNTVPARIIGEDAMGRIGAQALYIELASAPYGMDLERAKAAGVHACLESGLPGRYAPMAAGAALFDALQRAMKEGGMGDE